MHNQFFQCHKIASTVLEDPSKSQEERLQNLPVHIYNLLSVTIDNNSFFISLTNTQLTNY